MTKTLSLAKPLVIIMVGAPGAGKSFFARQFSEDFGAPHICFDRLRYDIFPEPAHSKEEYDQINKVAHYQLDELLKTKQSCVLDGGGNSRTDRIAIAKKAKQAGYDTLIVWVQTDPTTAKYRATKRSSKRADDTYNPSISDDTYKTLTKRLTPPNTTEATVVISGKHTYLTQLKTVLKKFAQPRSDNTTQVPQRPHPPQSSSRRSIMIR